jgi:DNA polymerase (family 10)
VSDAALVNDRVAATFELLADLLEIQGTAPYRPVAYRRAARRIRAETGSIADRVAAGTATELPDIGPTIAGKLEELLSTGSLAALEKARAVIPDGVVEIMRLPRVGPTTARRLHEALGVASVADLDRAARAGALEGVPGLGPSKAATIARAVAAAVAAPTRVRLTPRLVPLAEALCSRLRGHPSVAGAAVVGGVRRGVSAVTEVEAVLWGPDLAALGSALADEALSGVELADADGAPAATGVFAEGVPVRLWLAPADAAGAALLWRTGPEAYVRTVATAATARGLTLTPLGLLEAGGTRVPAPDEAALARAVGVDLVDPELRDLAAGRPELLEGGAPRLVEVGDVRGDLHTHTTWSDGRDDLLAMARAAVARGYRYYAITDHSPSLRVANGLSVERLAEQRVEIAAVQAKVPEVRLLQGAEVDILADGSLDLPDEVLMALDWVVASVHSWQGEAGTRATERMLAAMAHPAVRAVAHPTGRKLGVPSRTKPYPIDIEAVVARAAETGTCLECNGSPARRDLDEAALRLCADAGVPVVLDSDAHRTHELEHMDFAVLTARRAGLTADQVANTRDLDDLLALGARRA